MPRRRTPPNPFRWFDSSPEVIRMVVMMYVRYPPSLRNVEDLLHERGVEICHETVRLWVDRFGPMFAGQIRKRRVETMRQHTHWRWHLDEVYVKINGELHYLWRAVDHEGDSRTHGARADDAEIALQRPAAHDNARVRRHRLSDERRSPSRRRRLALCCALRGG